MTMTLRDTLTGSIRERKGNLINYLQSKNHSFSSNKFIAFFQRIWRAVKDFFIYHFTKGPKITGLNKNEKQILKRGATFYNNLNNKKINSVGRSGQIPVEPVLYSSTSNIPGAVREIKKYDPALERFQSFIRNFMDLLSENIYEQKFQDKENMISYLVKTLHTKLKEFAPDLIDIGDQVSRPIYNRIQEVQNSNGEPVANAITSQLTPTIHKFLDWLAEDLKTESSHPLDPQAIYQKVELAYNQAVEAQSDLARSAEERSTGEMVKPIVDWLLNSSIDSTHEDTSSLIATKKEEVIYSLSVEAIKESGHAPGNFSMKVLYRKLIERMKRKIDNNEVVLPRDHTLQQYCYPILSWFYSTNHQSPIKQSLTFRHPHTHTYESVIENCLLVFIESKIEYFSKKIKDNIEVKIHEFLKNQLFKKNVLHIADLLSKRLSDLIANMPFSETFDGVFKIFNEQIATFVSAEKETHKSEILCAKALEQINLQPINEDQFHNQVDYEVIKGYMEVAGGKEEYLQQESLLNFIKFGNVHESVQRMIDDFLAPHSRATITKEEKLELQKIVKRFMALLMPSKKEPIKVNDEELGISVEKEVEVDGMLLLLKEVILPKDLSDLLSEGEKLATEILPHEWLKTVKEFYNNMEFPVKKAAIKIIRKLVVDYVTNLAYKLYSNLVDPAYLEKLMATKIIPSIFDLLVDTFIRLRIQANLDNVKPFFQAYFYAYQKDDEQLPEIKRELFDKIYELLKAKFFQFNVGEDGFTREKFDFLCEPIVKSIIDHMGSKPFEDYFKYDAHKSSPNVPIFEELFMNIAFKLGGICQGSKVSGIIEWFANSQIKSTIATVLDSSILNYRKDHIALLNSGLRALEYNYLDNNVGKGFLVHSEKAPAFEEKTFDNQVSMIGGLAYDLIFSLIQDNKPGLMGKVYNWGARKFVLGNNKDKLVETIKLSFSKIIGSRIKNNNLALRIVDVFIGNMEEGIKPKDESADILEELAAI